MKYWRCPRCGKQRHFRYGLDEKLILKICPPCQATMEVVDDGR